MQIPNPSLHRTEGEAINR